MSNANSAKNGLFTFNIKFFILFIVIFLVEVFIAKYMHDRFIRPFGGDVLVVVLMYAFFRSFLRVDYKKIAIGVLLFSFLIETLQAFHYAARLGFADNRVMNIILGSSFSWYDMLAYFLGFLICLRIK